MTAARRGDQPNGPGTVSRPSEPSRCADGRRVRGGDVGGGLSLRRSRSEAAGQLSRHIGADIARRCNTLLALRDPRHKSRGRPSRVIEPPGPPRRPDRGRPPPSVPNVRMDNRGSPLRGTDAARFIDEYSRDNAGSPRSAFVDQSCAHVRPGRTLPGRRRAGHRHEPVGRVLDAVGPGPTMSSRSGCTTRRRGQRIWNRCCPSGSG
jgi:hypothetical protein